MAATRTAHDIKEKPRTGDVNIQENVDFRGLLLSENVLKGLSKCGFQRPSPIQLKAIPLGRCGLDLIVQAKSGTGKTCVFSVIALEGLILNSLATQVLVLAPTREIAVQICEVFNSIGSCMAGLECMTFIGGTPVSEDKQKLTHCHIAVGTPGRVKQLIEEKALATDSVRLFVLDEADKLLEANFQEHINWIFSSLPDNKQMLALSATYPEVLAQHLTAYMRNPTYLRLNVSDPALLGIRQYHKEVDFHPLPNKLFDRKTDALIELLSSVEFHQCLVFSNYQMRAESLSEVLNFRGWPATYISGNREQQDRMAAMTSLKEMTCRVLISTDLTSRGIDAENVNIVVNLDLPHESETYLHRIGRAGRFGTYGAGVSIVGTGKEMEDLKKLEKACNTRIKPLPDPTPTDLARSSGFMSLEHLVSTEKIITRDEDPVKSVVEQTKTSKSVAVDETPEVHQNGSSQHSPDLPCAEEPKAIEDDTQKNTEKQESNGLAKAAAAKTPNRQESQEVKKETGESKCEEQTENKPKWKTNNVWTNLSFSYGAECKQIDDLKKKGKTQNAGPKDQRRNIGPKAGPKGNSVHTKKKMSNGVEAELTPGPEKQRCDVNENIKKIDSDAERKVIPMKKKAAASIAIPSLKDIRGTSCKLCPFADAMQDFANFTVKGEPSQYLKKDSTEFRNVDLHKYLTKVSQLLDDAVNVDLSNGSQIEPKFKSEKPIAEKESAGVSSLKEVPHNTQTVQTTQCRSSKKEDAKALGAQPSKENERQQDLASIQNLSTRKQTVSEILPKTPTCVQHDDPLAKNISLIKEKSPKRKTVVPEAKQTQKCDTSTAESPPKGKANEQTTHYKKAEPSLETMMTNYEVLRESQKDVEPTTESGSPVPKTKEKPGKHAKLIDPYGAWEPYVAPEPVEPGTYGYVGEEEITGDEASEEDEESYDEEESELEFDYGAYGNQYGYVGAHGGQPWANFAQLGVGYPTGPWQVPSEEVPIEWQLQHVAQQAMWYSTMCYQQYMMHQQWASFYKNLLEEQKAQWNLGSVYSEQKKYIHKMAKWMAKHNK